ncbi:hypothetical protein ACFH04_09400 [Streptomyces noboritoensis]|uniref:Uncharacterized protein n=1 Tax=Streptomyces noboritoensis TaxID=67337 RepID=A0ABV6TDS2_9ACTN
MGRHRVKIDSDVVAALTWWAAILTGLGLLGASVSQELADGQHHGRATLSVPDAAPADGTV